MRNKNLSGGLLSSRPKPLTIRETPLSARITDWLDARRIYNDRLQCGKIQTAGGSWITLCKTGTPDRFAIIRGQIIFIEVKQRNEKPTPDQLEKHLELMRAGAIVLVADSFDQFVYKFSAIRASLESGEEMELNR
jgi:hypothetical protein